jgi:SAM-dependent methyltransferase
MPRSAMDLVNEPLWSSADVVREYEEVRDIQVPEAYFFARFADLIRNQRVLDLGCGGGRTARALGPLSSGYLGTDLSPAMVASASRRIPALRFEQLDARDMSRHETGSFDFALFSYNGIDSLDHEGRLRVLAEVRRVLKPGGVFVFSSHNRKFPHMKPRPMWCRNPITLLKNAAIFGVHFRRWNRLRRLEVRADEYEIRSDPAHDFRFLSYCIDKESQVRQAARCGLRISEMMDAGGTALYPGDEDGGTCWIYYAAEAV